MKAPMMVPVSCFPGSTETIRPSEEHNEVEIASQAGQQSVTDAAGRRAELPNHLPPHALTGTRGEFAGQTPSKRVIVGIGTAAGRGRLAHDRDAHRLTGHVPDRPTGRAGGRWGRRDGGAQPHPLRGDHGQQQRVHGIASATRSE
jgi:hypothetical protein